MRLYSIILFVIVFISSTLFIFINKKEDTIKVGLLYSKTGSMSVEEKVIAQMLYYKVQKINESGGLLNKKVQIVEYDGKSNAADFAKGAEFLINKGVKTIFGCWTSASRKAVKPIVEKNNAVLFYPVQYEGVEKSDNIVYLGATLNQQINPTLSYILKSHGKRVYIVGSDYIYPRMNGIYLDEMSKLIELDIVGKSYSPLGSLDFKELVNDIKKSKPDVIINTLNGNSNKAFFKELQNQNITATNIPVFSMSIDESTLNNISKTIDNKILDGHYITSSYFNSIKSLENNKLKESLKKIYGNEFVLTNSGYNTSVAVDIWKKSVLLTKSIDPINFLDFIKLSSINTISGIFYIDTNNNTYKNMRIGKIIDNNIEIIWSSDVLVRPRPFPQFMPEDFWLDSEKKLYKNWDNNWQAKSHKEGVK